MMIELTSATHMTVQYLRDLIIIGELKPGQKINETILATSIGLSRPPIREALRILEADSLVINIPRKSTYVSEISLNDFEETFQTRGMIEVYAIDLLKSINAKDFSSLDSALSEAANCRIEKGSGAMEVLRCLKIFADFHIRLVTLAGNSHILKFYKSILSNVWRYQFMYFSKRPTQPLFEAHDLITKNIKMGDYDEAKKVLLAHMSYNYEQMVNDEEIHIPA
jgi:DNA-binding GntR family transcriptional regulator